MPDNSELLSMRAYFETGATRSYTFRKEQLRRFERAIRSNEAALQTALYADLKKGPEETWITETGFVLAEIENAIRQLKKWMRPQRAGTNLLNQPSRSFILNEPLGVVLIIGPWNYPMQLLLTPLVGAIAAGNCAVVKPSEFAPFTSEVVKKIIHEVFDPQYILFAEGSGAEVIPAMMNNFVFDHVFYTGSTAVGKIIYQMAAKDLVPVTLELGGKSPCVIERDADLKVAARRIAMTKFSNAGQMCVAPDYLLVPRPRKDELVAAFKETLVKFFGADASQSEDYGKIINEKQFDRLSGYLQQGRILIGGKSDRRNLYIEPTILDNVSMDSPVMKEEIFGPILPVIPYDDAAEAKQIIALNKNPLAFYIFTSSSELESDWLNSVPFGGGCVNNAAFHLTNHELPFGGRGFSGSGQYHGKFSYDTFSHKKGILKTPTWFDPGIKYPPFRGKLKLIKWLMR